MTRASASRRKSRHNFPYSLYKVQILNIIYVKQTRMLKSGKKADHKDLGTWETTWWWVTYLVDFMYHRRGAEEARKPEMSKTDKNAQADKNPLRACSS